MSYLLEEMEGVPGSCDYLAEDLLEFADKAINAREYQLAVSIGHIVVEHCEKSLHRYGGEVRLRRVAWERSRMDAIP